MERGASVETMRFLFCESSDNLGGQELQIVLQMRALRAEGHETVLACRPASAIRREAERHDLTWRPVRFRNSLDVPSIAALRRVLREERIDAAFCHSGHDANNLALAARLVARRPLLIRARTYQPGTPKAFSYNRMVDRTVVPSAYLRGRILANRAIRPERVAVLRPIVPLEDLRADARAPLPQELAAVGAGAGPLVVHAAMLRAEKGHRIALETIAKLRGRFPGLRYVMAGRGPLEPDLRSHAARLRLDGVTVFAGLVSPVAPLLACADLVIMPSLDEPLGLAQLEALALGVPVAVSDAGGLPETVVHGETGWILPAGDVQAWRAGLAEALTDPRRAKTMAARGRSFVEAHYAPQAHLRALHAELESAAFARA
jgi:glycosyltransferase involved in cell wall biosynthesis